MAGRAEHSSWLSQGRGYGNSQERPPHHGLWCQTSPASLLWVLAPHALYKAQGQTSSPSPLGKQLIKLCSVPERSVGDVPASQPSPRACTRVGALCCAPGQGGLPCISSFERALTPGARGVTRCPTPQDRHPHVPRLSWAQDRGLLAGMPQCSHQPLAWLQRGRAAGREPVQILLLLFLPINICRHLTTLAWSISWGFMTSWR